MSPPGDPGGRDLPILPVAEAPARLGPDLWALVARLAAPLVEARILTALPSPVMGHASFRLRLADGRTLKGRRVETPAQARRVAGLLLRLGRRHFPRVLARRGRALLEEWVPGTPLAIAPSGAAVQRRCGAILGAIHAAPPPRGPMPAPCGAGERLAAAERQLARLADLGALTRGSARRAVRQLRAHVPDRVAVGIIHRDFCAENIVLTAAGGLRVVDNETLRVDACELDLARTWYRWPMPRPRFAAFLAGYRARRDPASFLRHFPFWAIAVLADTALFRLRAGTAGASVPVRRLEALLDRLERPRRGRPTTPRDRRPARARA